MSSPTTGPEADARRAALIAKIEKHNGEPLPKRDGPPPKDDDLEAEVAPPTAPSPSTPWALVVAIIWAIAAVIIGLIFIFGVNSETYGGDAYTGIEGAIVQAVHAVGWVIISTGALGVIIAGSRVRDRR